MMIKETIEMIAEATTAGIVEAMTVKIVEATTAGITAGIAEVTDKNLPCRLLHPLPYQTIRIILNDLIIPDTQTVQIYQNNQIVAHLLHLRHLRHLRLLHHLRFLLHHQPTHIKATTMIFLIE